MKGKIGIRGQLKIQQMAFMLIAVTLFFVLVGLLVLGIMLSGFKKSATLLEKERAMALVSKLANSPEFSCGESLEGVRKIACVDADKMIILQGDSYKYNKFWDVASIKIIKIYPKNSVERICNKGNYPDCNIIELYSQNVNSLPPVSNFVSLCRKEKSPEGELYEKCELAKLMISARDKTDG